MNLGLAKALDRVLGGLAGAALSAGDRFVEMVAPPPPVADVRHVLVMKFWGLGNWALLRPVILDLRARYPAAHFTVATLAGNVPLAQDLAERLVVVHPSGLLRSARDLAAAALRMRRDPPDLSVDFEPFARAGALLARLGGARQRLGFATGRGSRDGLYTVTVPFRREVHAGRNFRDLAEAAGVAPADYRPGGLAPTARGRAAAEAVAPRGSYVLLHPGSGDNFPGRRWSEAGFAAVGRAASAAGLHVVVTGSAAERPLAARVAAAVGAGAVNAAGGLSLEGLVALVADARALVSNDTGPVHLASALAVPTLAIFGPNTPAIYGPLAPGSRAFYRALPCSPCITAANYRSSRCRIFACMAAIPTGEVVAGLQRLLAAHPQFAPEPSACPPATNG